MYLHKLHAQICADAEDNPNAAWQMATEAGLKNCVAEMIAASVVWYENREDITAACAEVIIDSGSPFWRGVAYEHIGARAKGDEARINSFQLAITEAATMPECPDRRYIEMNAAAGLLRIEGATSPWPLDDVVTWMVNAGAYNAPGQTEVTVRQMHSNGKRGAADALFANLVHQATTRTDVHYSRYQMGRLTAYMHNQ